MQLITRLLFFNVWSLALGRSPGRSGNVTLLPLSSYHRSFRGPPDVVLIGTAKSGSTTIADMLTSSLGIYQKPFINGRLVKEPDFFSIHYNDKYFTKYIQGYTENKLAFDGSVSYFLTGKSISAKRFYELYHPEDLHSKKFLLSLRDPIAQKISSYYDNYGRCIRWNTNGINTPAGSSSNRWLCCR